MNKIEKLEKLMQLLIFQNKIKNQKDFGQRLGYKNESSFSQIVNDESKITERFSMKIKKLYPDFNTNYLLKDDEEMFLDSSNVNNTSVKIEHSAMSSVETATNCTFNNNAYQKPCLDERAGGNVPGCPDGVLIPVDIRTIPNDVRLRGYLGEAEGRGLCLKYEIRTNLMWPRLSKGDLIIMHLIEDRGRLISGRCYVVDSPRHGKMIRRLHIRGGCYVLALPDPKETGPALEIPMEDAGDVDFYEMASRISTDIDSVFCEETYNYQHLALTLADNEKRLLRLMETITNSKG